MKQILLLGLTGPFDPQLVAEITQLITAKKLQVQHASNRSDGTLHIYTGTPDDIKDAVAECGGSCVGIQMSDVPQLLTPLPAATGDLAEVLQVMKRIDETTTITLGELREFVDYEKTDDAPKPRRPRAKKEGASAPTPPPPPTAADGLTGSVGGSGQGPTGQQSSEGVEGDEGRSTGAKEDSSSEKEQASESAA